MKNGSCPRRMDEFGPWDRSANLDGWRDDQTCSFCGSLDPAEAIRLIESGQQVCPTDKNYKMYVNSPVGEHKVYFQHFSNEQGARLIELLNAKKINFAYPGRFYVRPYFVKSAPPADHPAADDQA